MTRTLFDFGRSPNASAVSRCSAIVSRGLLLGLEHRRPAALADDAPGRGVVRLFRVENVVLVARLGAVPDRPVNRPRLRHRVFVEADVRPFFDVKATLSDGLSEEDIVVRRFSERGCAERPHRASHLVRRGHADDVAVRRLRHGSPSGQRGAGRRAESRSRRSWRSQGSAGRRHGGARRVALLLDAFVAQVLGQGAAEAGLSEAPL
jgi:hypothetical protein